MKGVILILSTALIAVVAPLASGQSERYELEGFASWYGGKFQGRLTASGEVFDTLQLTAAHKTLPFGTVVEVTNLNNGLSVRVRINDRGPFVEGRVIDLSRAAADALDMAGAGVAPVRLSIISMPESSRRSIQIASFSLSESALRTETYLANAGIDASIEVVRLSDGSTIHRVVILGVADEDVDAMVSSLASLGFETVFVRSR